MKAHGPNQISVTGYDDSVYASMVRPKLTTVHQDVPQKAHVALKRLLKLISGRDIGRIKYKKSSLSGKEGFCQGMTGSFFQLCMYTGKPVEWSGCFCADCIKAGNKLCCLL